MKMSKRIGPTFHKAREAYSRLNSVVQENISGNRIFKAFSKENYEIENEKFTSYFSLLIILFKSSSD